MITVALAEDHKALVDGIESYMKYLDDIMLVGHADNGRDLVALVERKRPKVVITDIRMPIMDGIEATRQIKKISPDTKVIAFTMFDQEDAVREMLDAGASGYILKNSSLDILLIAIEKVNNGEIYFDDSIEVDSTATHTKDNVLTRRQIEILKLIAQGKNNREIAELLFIGKTTVETHRKNMIRALNLKGAGELLRYALEKKYAF